MDGLQTSRNIVKFASVSFFLTQILLCCSSVRVYEDVTFEDISCNNSGIAVDVSFKENFQGIIYSHGNFFNPTCSYTTLAATKNITLFFPLTDCGTVVKELHGKLDISNLVVIQKHRFVETASDMVHKVSCELPYPKIQDTEEVWTSGNHSNRYKNNMLESWMDFKLGSNILGKDVSNNLLVGDEFSMVIHLKDNGTNKDIKVESCWAHEGETIEESRYTLQIYDRYACESSDIVSNFNLTKETEKVSGFMTYAVVKAFKFPMTNNLHITCSVKLCKESCPDYCKVPEFERYNGYQRLSRRSTSEDSKSLRERYKLMRATIKILGAKLMESNRAHRSNENLNFRRRISNSDINTTSSYEFVPDSENDYSEEHYVVSSNSPSKNLNSDNAQNVYLFNLTNRIVVFKSHDFNFRHDYNSPIELSLKCVSKLKFGITIAALSLISSFLLIACVGLVLYLRKERKKHKINNYLLYNFF